MTICLGLTKSAGRRQFAWVIALIDYGLGNLRSVQKALEHVGADVRVVDSAEGLAGVSGVVFPGQGAFRDCVARLRETGLDGALRDWVLGGKPFFGICLGLQALFETSEESAGGRGLAVVPGCVKKFSEAAPVVPHMGWNGVKSFSQDCPVFAGVEEEAYFYFDHSYYGEPEGGDWQVGLTEHGESFPSVIWRERCFAVQFHPEKSQRSGLKMLKNFLQICGGEK